MKHFTLETREDVERFETLLGEYSQARSQIALSHISLVKAWDQLHQREDGGRVFTALLDLYLTLHLVEFDLTNVGGTWNSLFSKGKLEGGSILDSQQKFFGKMDIHRFATSFVLRYRAIWDKLMGFFVLYFDPMEYDSFYKSDSKKRPSEALPVPSMLCPMSSSLPSLIASKNSTKSFARQKLTALVLSGSGL